MVFAEKKVKTFVTDESMLFPSCHFHHVISMEMDSFRQHGKVTDHFDGDYSIFVKKRKFDQTIQAGGKSSCLFFHPAFFIKSCSDLTRSAGNITCDYPNTVVPYV